MSKEPSTALCNDGVFERSNTPTSKRFPTTDLSRNPIHLGPPTGSRSYLGLESIDTVLQSTDTRRTFDLLSSLVEPRLTATDWRTPLLEYRTRGYCHHPEESCEPRNSALDLTDSLQASTPSSQGYFSQPSPSAFSPSTSSSSRPLCGPVSLETKAAAQKLIDVFEMRYVQRFDSLVGDALRVENRLSSRESDAESEIDEDLPLSPEAHALRQARVQYMAVLRGLFANRINWGRVVAMLSFLRALCEMLETARLHQAPTSSNPPFETCNQSGQVVMAQSAEWTRGLDQPDSCASSTSASLLLDLPPPPTNLHVPTSGPHGCSSKSSSDSGVERTPESPPAVAGDATVDRRAVHYLIWTTEYIHNESNVGAWIEENGDWEGLVDFEGGEGSLHTQFTRALASIGGLVLGSLGLAAAFRFFTHRS